ncbi:16367_t:CDS:2 [Gigaspora margarita]|uniref:16367_t:CDS:1 n=1 Tax=Gigaspora margarita TaxID=4874 RepID=A0ABM8VZL3_GIGMA|nr:16367_t:CDS:2 [Gigaspora margarita]
MSDYELDNEINQEQKNNKGKDKGKAIQKADNWHISVELIDQLFSDNNIEDNWEDINDDRLSEHSADDDLIDQFINFDASPQSIFTPDFDNSIPLITCNIVRIYNNNYL